ncbi:MAG: DUF6894 family protein [Pseudorhizobium sp.]
MSHAAIILDSSKAQALWQCHREQMKTYLVPVMKTVGGHMRRYYFHVRSHETLEKDPEGVELPSDTAALEEAVLAAREIICERIRAGAIVDGEQFEVSNDQGEVVHVLPLRAVLRLQ